MLLWFLAILLIVAFCYMFLFRKQKKVKALYKFLTFGDICNSTAIYIKGRLYVNKRATVSQEQQDNEVEEKHLFRRTIEECRKGYYPARTALIDEIATYLVGGALNIESLDDLSCIVFRDPNLMTSNEKFETMMYFTQKSIIENSPPDVLYDEDNDAHLRCFGELADQMGWLAHKRPLKTAPHLYGYYVDEEDLTEAFKLFMRSAELEIALEDAVQITSILVFQKLFGFGPIDTLVYDNSLDEIELGTCGATHGSARHVVSPLNSTLLSVKNELLRLQFLNFASETELQNTIIALADNGEGTFTANDGYKFTTLLNLRRVTVRREPLADKFSVNVRKLDIEVMTNVELLLWNRVPIHGVPQVGELLQIFAWSLINLAWIGDQGAGKTSHINAYPDLLEEDVASRAFGNIDESQFGNRYPERDIQHYFQTPRQSLHEVAGVGRRTKGKFFILMEVIDSESGQEAINNIKSGYVGGMMSGHGGSPQEMVEFMAQLLAMGQSTSSTETTKIVASVLNICVKVIKYGTIFCYESISEIVPREWSIDWQDIHPENIDLATSLNQKLFFNATADPSLFTVNEIVVFDKETNTYIMKNKPSLGLCSKIFFRLGKNRRRFFFDFMTRVFDYDVLQDLIDNDLLVLSAGARKEDWY